MAVGTGARCMKTYNAVCDFCRRECVCGACCCRSPSVMADDQQKGLFMYSLFYLFGDEFNAAFVNSVVCL